MWFSAIADNDKEELPGGCGDNNAPAYAAAALASLISPSGNSLSQHGEEEEESSYNPTLPPIHFVSRRSPIYCTKACVATSQPLATSVGLHILRGCKGNAADASVAIAAALAVVSTRSGAS